MPRKLTDSQVRRIRELHALDWCERDIAGVLGVSQRCINNWRHRLGLPAVGYGSLRNRAKMRAAYDKVCQDNGVDSLGAIWSISRRIARLRAEREALTDPLALGRGQRR